jgi:hypothetical protein
MDYYEMSIICEGSSDGGKEFFAFYDEIKIFCSANEAREWLKEQYGDRNNVKRMQMYHGSGIPCGYIFEYENADWSHSPVEKWTQRDWITVEKCHSDNAFKEIEYEIPDVEKM